MNTEKFQVRKANGETEPFDVLKLEHSLTHAKASKAAITHITSHILHELEDGMSTQEIYSHAFDLLHKMEHRSALRYSLRKAIMELGPSGFPFEQIVSEIFKAQGYKTLTDQIVHGHCAEHEVDVIAWKPGSLIMSEVKFHGQPGLKSDLKVVLYVQARFEDLSKKTYTYGNEQHTLSEGWLVTNTKFSISALKYAECKGMKIVGWNYPLDGNLHDFIEEANLHPLTCLHTLSDHDKKALLAQNIVLCKSLIEDPSILKSMGFPEEKVDMVIDEIRLIAEETKRAV